MRSQCTIQPTPTHQLSPMNDSARVMNIRVSTWTRRMALAIAGLFLASGLAGTVAAQAPPQQPPKAAAPVRPNAPGKRPVEDPKMKPRWVTMRTKDGVELRAFYAPSDKGKEAIPVLIVHEWQGQGSPYGPLVSALHGAGCAVLVPEYRGHGGSRSYTDNTGRTQEFNLGTMGKMDIEKIIRFDMEEAKQFLKKENNEGNLNLNALVVMGVREGAVIGSHWAMQDWKFPSIGRIKQGQDVKGLVLISPEKNAKGVGIDVAMRDPVILQLPIMIVAGADSSDASEAQRLGKQVENVKKRVSRGEAQGFKLAMVPTSLSGPSLVGGAREVIPMVVSFVTSHVKISDEQNPWVERE